MTGRWKRTLAAAAALAVAAGLVAAVPAAAAPGSVTLVGHGYGHGRGLGQYGALGYAVDQGWSARTILDHYYNGTDQGVVGNSPISVRLTVLDSAAGTWITAGQGFTVGGVHIEAGAAARVTRDGGSWQLFTAYGGCRPGEQYGPYPLPANPTITLDADPGDTLSRMLTTCANATQYRGSLAVIADNVGGALRVVNTLPVEQYLRGVVPRESVASWADLGGGRGMQALAAQAVAARSYALSERRYAYAMTCDTIACQVYGGAGRNGASVEDRRTDFAVAASAGVVRVRGGAVVHTEFGSSTGGRTTGPSFGHVQDWGDLRSPHNTWRVELTGAAITAAYPQIGQFTALQVTRRDGEGAQGGRVLNMDVVGSAGRATVTGDQFRSAMGLRSNWFFPMQQATSVSYVKTQFSDTVYQLAQVNGWSEKMAMTWDDYVAAGYPAVGSIASNVVKYSWAPGLVAVTFWPGDPQWQWDFLDYDRWARAGYPAPAEAGWIINTSFWGNGVDPTIYAQAPDGTVTALSYAQWAAAGYPKPEVR
ncbi:SpoIID/LytB domain-containing protein [Nakamurella deserti]|uniref:SpoIID/LytB domain-containing protein n=1 Tax=Nakamurella deserti TaxID=2164074 RepID=UPI000DBE5DE7|nr:SpoIID/LytB domain-containing protein [Nakamurella deserti]